MKTFDFFDIRFVVEPQKKNLATLRKARLLIDHAVTLASWERSRGVLTSSIVLAEVLC